MESSLVKRAVASVRVKDVGVLATPNTFRLNVDKFSPVSLSHDSLFGQMRAISVQCEDPPLLLDIKQTENRFPAVGVPKQRAGTQT